jgi:multidrug efflux pump subunit AcrA (membrane-fusion protein)
MIYIDPTQQPQDVGAQVRQAVDQARAAQLQAQMQANLARQQAQEQVREAQDQARQAQQQAQEAAREARDQARQAVDQVRREMERTRFGRPVVAQFPPGFPGQPQIPEGVVVISVAFFAMCAFIAVGFPLVRAWARRLDRRSVVPTGTDAETRGRLERIEQAVDAIAVEIERISEGQRFTTKVIGDLRALPQADPSIPLNDRDRSAVPLSRAREAR